MTRRKRDGSLDLRRPPKSSQFAKGKSGNPLGRPRSTLPSMLQQAKNIALRRESVVEDGISKKLTERQISLARLVNRMMGGDLKAWKQFVRMCLGNKSASKFAGLKIIFHPDPE